MAERTVFLVYGANTYEYPCDPIRAFAIEEDAQAFLATIEAYQRTKPSYPRRGCTDAEYDAWDKQDELWRKSHPAGDACGHDGFDVMPLQLVEIAE